MIMVESKANDVARHGGSSGGGSELYLPIAESAMGRTPHPLSRSILGCEGRLEGGAAAQHGASDVEKAVCDGSEGTAVAVTSGSQGSVFGAAGAVVLCGGTGPVVEGVCGDGVAGLPHHAAG